MPAEIAAAPPETPGRLPPLAARLVERTAALLAALPADAPADFRAGAERMAQAAERFAAAVNSANLSRHDLKGLLNRVLGGGQILHRKHPGGHADQLTAIVKLGWEANRQIDRPEDGEAPPAAPVAEALAAPDAAPDARPVAAALPHLARILIVDDDDEGRRDVRHLLRGLGYEVWEAADGRQAIHLAEKVAFDLILLDLNLPEADGLTVLKAMREGRGRSEVPVLMVSGEHEIDKIAACLKARANDFLTKPVDHGLLRVKVEANIDTRRQHLRMMEKFFPPEIARQLIDNPELVNEARDAEVSVLFCDIRGFSRLSEKLGTVQTLQLVRDTMAVLTQCVADYRGVVVDFIGDGMMAMWGAPSNQPDHAQLACRAALAMIDCLPELNARWAGRLPETLDYSIGINSGVAQVGNMGTEQRFKYGVLGNVVNVASRVQGATKYLKTRLVVSQSTLDRVGTEFESRRLAEVRVVNIGEPLQLHELVKRGEPGWAETKARYEEALSLYESHRLPEAAKVLSGVIQGQEVVEGPAVALMARTMEALISRDRWSRVADLPGK